MNNKFVNMARELLIWPWVWVLSPLWISWIVAFVFSFFIQEDEDK